MKKILFIAFTSFLLSVTNSKAQITLDTIISPLGMGYDFYTVQISPNETKYYFGDTATNTFSLYNMDFTPFMQNIAVPEPFNNFNLQVLYVTRSLFDCDTTNIEYVFAAPVNSFRKPFRIMRTDGTKLFQLDSAVGLYCTGGCLGFSDVIVPIRNTSAGAKLFLNKPDDSGAQHIHIYSLCSDLPLDIFDFKKANDFSAKLFPTPSSGKIVFQINQPDNLNEYDIVIFDSNGKEAWRKKLEATTKEFLVDMSGFNDGVYFYSLSSGSVAHSAGKFILTK